MSNIPECIYSKYYNSRESSFWKRLCCCHVWINEERYMHDKIRIEKNRCVICGKIEILHFIYWPDKKKRI